MLYFITGNQGKFKEVKAILPEIEQLDIDLEEIQEIDAKKIIEHKLNEAIKHKQGGFIVEDTSLYLEGLNGLPGPLIKWFLQSLKNEGLAELTMKLGNDKAEAVTIIGYAKNENDIHFFEGRIKGKIVKERGENGFGWSSIFQPNGHEKTFAEMEDEEKYSLSMRRLATEKLKNYLIQTSSE